MPRQKIDLPYQIDYLSILGEDGRCDADLEPEIPENILLKLHQYMVLGRRFDGRLLSLQRQGRIGTFPPITGQEAAQLGAVAPLGPSDWLVPSFRETAAELWRGKTMENIIIYNNGFSEGGKVEEDRNDLPVSVPVASQILHAVGLGWAIKYRGKNDVALTFFGDGATSEGDFHEGLNFAGVYQVPVVFVCQNNQWAISIPRSKQTRSKTLAQKALAYAIEGIQVDGNDLLAVYAAAKEAIDRARSGKGPTLIECVTYRLLMHTTADDPRRYRNDEEVEEWNRKDPLHRFQKYLLSKGLLTEEKIKGVETDADEKIEQAVNRAEERIKSLGDPLDMFEHAYAEPPPRLQEQKKELAQILAESNGESSHG